MCVCIIYLHIYLHTIELHPHVNFVFSLWQSQIIWTSDWVKFILLPTKYRRRIVRCWRCWSNTWWRECRHRALLSFTVSTTRRSSELMCHWLGQQLSYILSSPALYLLTGCAATAMKTSWPLLTWPSSLDPRWWGRRWRLSRLCWISSSKTLSLRSW